MSATIAFAESKHGYRLVAETERRGVFFRELDVVDPSGVARVGKPWIEETMTGHRIALMKRVDALAVSGALDAPVFAGGNGTKLKIGRSFSRVFELAGWPPGACVGVDRVTYRLRGSH